jgi:hypothetical protein
VLRWPKVGSLSREPLLHFLLIGMALFLFSGRVAQSDSNSRRIVVSERRVDEMIRQYKATWSRPPTSAELRGLIDAYVHDEITYREGLSLGLDKDDAVIKRRIRQKYDLISEEEEQAEPTDADLAAYLKAHPAKFMRSAVVSFEQVYFDPSISSPAMVDTARGELAKGADPAKFGQPSMLPRYVTGGSIDLVARDFGDSFAQRLAEAPIGKWIGPLASGIGVHLIRVSARASPNLPPLNQVRAAVAREWESDQRSQSSEADYVRARGNYEVVIKAKLS